MTRRDLTSVLLAVLGVYLVVSAITQASTAAFFLTLDSTDEFLRQSHTDQGLLFAAVFGMQLGLGLAVLFLHKPIAARLFPEPSRPPSQSTLPDLQAAAFAVLGVYFVITSIAALAQAILPPSPHSGLSDLWPSHAGNLAQGVLGLALLLGARAASGAWFLARQAGRAR